MTYYQVEFLTPSAAVRPAKKFRTAAHAKKHAKRVLGLVDDSHLGSKITIVAVDRHGLPAE